MLPSESELKLPKDEDVIGALAAIFLGLVGLAILASIFGPRCPKCGRPVQRGIRVCPHCGAILEW
jgi:rubrerythrin